MATDSPLPPNEPLAKASNKEPLPARSALTSKEDPVTTTTTTTTTGFADILPSLIPALQSSSYVLVILFAFLAWSSRKLVADFLDRHIDLMQTVKENLEAERVNNEKHLAILTQLSGSNMGLTAALQALALGQDTVNRVPKGSPEEPTDQV